MGLRPTCGRDARAPRNPPTTRHEGEALPRGMAPPHPGAFIRIEAIEASGSSVSVAVTRAGRTRGTLRGERRAHSSEIHSGIRAPAMINSVQPADFGCLCGAINLRVSIVRERRLRLRFV